tara:strand:- start:146 stop:982 length:837 start_codon:yes stop_codon:yes gene_type:complete
MGNKILSVSLVMYRNSIEELTVAIQSVLKSSLVEKVFLIDNSPEDSLKVLRNLDNSRIEYFFQNDNLGFGKAHNVAIRKARLLNFNYHLVINPDISVEKDILGSMIEFMKSDSNVGMMMPQILNYDGSVQYLPKLLPSPLSLVLRKLKFYYFAEHINKYELRKANRYAIINVPVISGCFTLFNMRALDKVGLYDDRFFMYFEDWDLSRRVHTHYKALYYPLVSVNHGYKSGANSNLRLFRIFIQSAIRYFNKWGWFYDVEKRLINRKTLNDVNVSKDI